MTAKTKTAKLVSSLQGGKKMTATQIQEKFGFGSINSVYATISTLRENGYHVKTTQGKNGLTQYALAS